MRARSGDTTVGPPERVMMMTTHLVEPSICAPAARAGGASASFGQRPMDELDADRPLADGRRDALDAVRSDVADSKDAGAARLQQVRRALQPPGREILLRQIGAGLDESFAIERDAIRQPTGVRAGSGHEEEMADGHGEPLIGA